jgi:small subunit ribosomal protein S18
MAKDYGRDKDKDSRYSDDMEDAMDDMGGKRGRKFSGGNRKKACRFTTGEEDPINITYKNPKFLSSFMTEHGKIVPRRVTGNCASIQRKLTAEIKRARILGLLGYTSIGPNSNY